MTNNTREELEEELHELYCTQEFRYSDLAEERRLEILEELLRYEDCSD